MIRTQISFDKSLYERGKRAAKRRGVSLAELCRRSIAEYVARDDTRHPWMSYVGTVWTASPMTKLERRWQSSTGAMSGERDCFSRFRDLHCGA